jgi:hypothetical protein
MGQDLHKIVPSTDLSLYHRIRGKTVLTDFLSVIRVNTDGTSVKPEKPGKMSAKLLLSAILADHSYGL